MRIRSPLPLRQVEDPLFERGIDIWHETMRIGRQRPGNFRFAPASDEQAQTPPSWPASGQGQWRRRRMAIAISSKCQRSLGLGRVRRRLAAMTDPNFRNHRRTVSFGEHLLDIAKAQRGPRLGPDRMADHPGREAVRLEGELTHRFSLRPSSLSRRFGSSDHSRSVRCWLWRQSAANRPPGSGRPFPR